MENDLNQKITNYKPFLIIFAFLILSAGVYYWLSLPQTIIPSVQIAIVLDQSDSIETDKDCLILTGLVKRSLEVKGIRKGSKMFISGTGNPSTAMEPVQFASFEIPAFSRVMEGKESIKAARKELILNLVSECKKRNSTAKTSPIFLAVKRALEQLKAVGCDSSVLCYLFIRTDGEETEEPWLKNSLKTGKQFKTGQPMPLDNQGIQVVFCGFSETIGELIEKNKKKKLTPIRNAERAEFLNTLWSKVFTQPEKVIFEPFCPKNSL